MESKQKIMYLNPIGFASCDAFFAEVIRENKFSNTEVYVTSLISNVEFMDNLEFRTYNALIASDLIKASRQATKEYGYGASLASFRNVLMSVSEFQKDHIITENKLLEAAEKAINKDYVDSIILGCTLEFGFYKTIQEKFKILAIDPSIAALKQAEQTAMLKNKYNWKPSRKWSCKAPSENDLKFFRLFTKDYEFGNRIIIN